MVRRLAEVAAQVEAVPVFMRTGIESSCLRETTKHQCLPNFDSVQ